MTTARQFQQAIEYMQKKTGQLSWNQMNDVALRYYSGKFDGIKTQWNFPDGSSFNLIENQVIEDK